MSKKYSVTIIFITALLFGIFAGIGWLIAEPAEQQSGDTDTNTAAAGQASNTAPLAAYAEIRFRTPVYGASGPLSSVDTMEMVAGRRQKLFAAAFDEDGTFITNLPFTVASSNTNFVMPFKHHSQEAGKADSRDSHAKNEKLDGERRNGHYLFAPGKIGTTVIRLEGDAFEKTLPVNVVYTPELAVMAKTLYYSTGLANIDWGQAAMMLVGLLLIYLAISKGFEPLLLIPIGFGAILSNIPIAGISGPDGLIGMVYNVGIGTGVFPLLIFMGVGAMTDFGPLIANPRTALLGASAQFGIFATLIGALALTGIPGIEFSLQDAAAIGIIGGADGPTAIFLTSKLAPDLLGAIAVAAYSYMALVPIIQPPIIRLLTTKEERQIKMEQLRHVTKVEKIVFPLIILGITLLLLPDATPLIGMLMFGNLARECGVVDRLSKTIQNSLINIVTIFLGLAVGSKLQAAQFLQLETIGILILGLVAFSIGTGTGLVFGKLMKKLTGGKVNPMIGAAGVSAVPMAARVVNSEGMRADKSNFLLMHAMGPNVAGVIGSAVAAGILLSIFGG